MSADLYARLGDAGIEQLVDRLYHWMEHLPEAHEAHRLHGPDLGEVKRRLGAFLSGWLGGPDRYRPLYGEGALWVRPYAMFVETVDVDGVEVLRFAPVSASTARM